MPDPEAPTESADIAVIGAGAAGLFAAIWAGRTLRAAGSSARVVALDSAKSLGAKILVAGGGRCNVTHFEVDERAYAGSSRNSIKSVLRAFGVPRTIEFFRELGVELKREDTGKLFPTTDSARTVLDALLRTAAEAQVQIRNPWRVNTVEPRDDSFLIHNADTPPRTLAARRIVLATGGMSLPKTGSDGHGYSIARALGHTITDPVFPALVPLTVDPARSFLPSLSGLTHTCTVEVLSSTNKRIATFTNSLLCTHFGLSGPAILDVSRYLTDARRTDPCARLILNWLPGQTFEQVDALLGANTKPSIGRRLAEALPERLARALCVHAGADPLTPISQLRRDDRRAIARAITALEVPITGDRGWLFAEVTAGGIPLTEVRLATMESRVRSGLHLCGEICDVDGRIGGFNFQWAWASGYAAGVAAANALLSTQD